MKILLVYPTPPQGVWPYSLMYSQWIPAGLSQMAGELLRDGHEVHIHMREQVLVDNSLDWIAADRAFQDKLRRQRPDMVGFSIVSAAINECARLALITREILGEKAILVAGGPHPTAMPQQTLEDISVLDAVVIGEGERTMSQLASGGLSEDIHGIAVLKNSSLAKAPPRERITDLDTLAMPAWELFDMNFHTRPNRWMLKWLNLSCINIRTSRGCPNVCSFCAGHVTIGAGVRFHSAEYVMDQLHRAVKDYRVQGVLFEDETFAADQDRLFEICRQMRRDGLADKLQWAACLRVDQASEEILREMKASGCFQVEYGFESGSDKTLRAVAKNSSMDMNRRAVELSRRAGLRIYADIMFNLPGETAEDFKATVDFIRWSKPDVMSAVLLAPLPGTKLFNDMSEQQKRDFVPEATAYHELPKNMVNFSAMSDSKMLKRYRKTRKSLLTPMIHRQILRDCGPEDKELKTQIKKRLRSFLWRHPLKALRIPRM